MRSSTALLKVNGYQRRPKVKGRQILGLDKSRWWLNVRDFRRLMAVNNYRTTKVGLKKVRRALQSSLRRGLCYAAILQRGLTGRQKLMVRSI